MTGGSRCDWARVGAAMLLFLIACAPRTTSNRLRVALSPASFSGTISLQQHVHVEMPGREADFDAVLEISPLEVTLVAITFGQRLLTLRYDGIKLTESRHPMLPAEVQGSDILSDMQLALWPEAAVRATLPPGWNITDSLGHRAIVRGEREIVEITYGAIPRWNSLITIHNIEDNYRLEVRSVKVSP